MMYQNTSWNEGGNVYRIVDGTIYLADLGALDGWKELENLKSLESLKGLETLKDLSKLKDSKYLKKRMKADTWKHFEENMGMLEKRLEGLE